MTFYNEQMVAQKHSVVLTKWKAEREAERAAVKNVTADSALVSTGDTENILRLFNFDSNKVSVTPFSAQRLSAVGACIGVIGDAMSTLPLHHFKKTKDGRERISGSLIERLFNSQPCKSWTSASMFQWWVRCNILRGDAICYIIRDRSGQAIGLVPFHPDRVQWTSINVIVNAVGEAEHELIYKFSPLHGKAFNAYADDVLHIPGSGFDGVRSLSAISNDAYHGIGLALSINQYSKKFFENGASPKHIFEAAGQMSPEQIDNFRELYDSRYSGPANAGRPMVLTEGLTAKELSMTSVDAQLLETLKYSVIDVARACRVPPVLIGAQETTSSWGSGVGEIKQGFVTFHLEPKANLWAQEINRKLIRKPDEFVEFEFKGFLKGDTKAEAESLRQGLGGSQGPGWMTTNEVRRTQNLPPVEGGDTLYIPKGTSNEQKTAAAN